MNNCFFCIMRAVGGQIDKTNIIVSGPKAMEHTRGSLCLLALASYLVLIYVRVLLHTIYICNMKKLSEISHLLDSGTQVIISIYKTSLLNNFQFSENHQGFRTEKLIDIQNRSLRSLDALIMTCHDILISSGFSQQT